MHNGLSKIIIITSLFLLLCFPVSAVSTTGEIAVTPRGDDGSAINQEVTIFYAGNPVQGGYRLTEQFGGGIIAFEDVFSSNLAAWMEECAAIGISGETGDYGTVFFPDLEYGLYLVTSGETGMADFRPYLVCVSEEIPYVDIYPEAKLSSYENPLTADRFSPTLFLLLMLISADGFVAIRKYFR